MGSGTSRRSQPGQLIFLDTPGDPCGTTPLNRAMIDMATGTFRNCRSLLLIAEAGPPPHRTTGSSSTPSANPISPFFWPSIKSTSWKTGCCCRSSRHTAILYPFREQRSSYASFRAERPGRGSPTAEMRKALPEGPRYFPEEMMTDRSERFVAAEIIREKITIRTHQEIPYATAVVVRRLQGGRGEEHDPIAATIHVAKESQKGIIIGKRGTMLNEIGHKGASGDGEVLRRKVFLEGSSSASRRTGPTTPGCSGSSGTGRRGVPDTRGLVQDQSERHVSKRSWRLLWIDSSASPDPGGDDPRAVEMKIIRIPKTESLPHKPSSANRRDLTARTSVPAGRGRRG